MDHNVIEEQQIVDRYLMGQLPAEEAERFEEHYFHCQQCLEQLQLAEKLQRGFKRATAQDVAKVTAAQRLGVLAWLARAARSPRAGLAALALAVIALLPAGLMYRQLSGVYQPQINTAVFTMSPERSAVTAGEEPSHVIRLSGDSEWLVLSLELDLPEHERYRVTLSRNGAGDVWQRDGLEPDHLDALGLSLHSDWLLAGDYAARVEGLADGEPVHVANFAFRVLADN